MGLDEMKKMQIFSSFLEANKIEKTNPIVIFKAVVEYVELSICDVTKVQMKLDSFYYGDIDVYPTAKIDINNVHTGFSVPFNEYQLDNQTLVIKGAASPAKGSKDYTVRITPV